MDNATSLQQFTKPSTITDDTHLANLLDSFEPIFSQEILLKLVSENTESSKRNSQFPKSLHRLSACVILHRWWTRGL
jgi:hypothetical protein